MTAKGVKAHDQEAHKMPVSQFTIPEKYNYLHGLGSNHEYARPSYLRVTDELTK